MPNKASLIVCPAVTLMDETCDITCHNLGRYQSVSVLAVIHNDEDDAVFYSYGKFLSDTGGNLDVNRSFSYEGTYTGIESMALFWSAISAPGQRNGLRLIKRVVDTSLDWNLFLIEGAVDEALLNEIVKHVRCCKINSSQSGPTKVPNEKHLSNLEANNFSDVTPLTNNKRILAQATAKRYYCYPSDVIQIPIRDGKIRGIVYSLKDKNGDGNDSTSRGKRKGIIEVYGGGSFKMHRAALLAQRGFVVFGLAYCDYDDLPRLEIDTTGDYFVDAVDYMLSDRFPVRFDTKSGIGLIGLCKGATLLLELAAVNPQRAIRCAVAINAPCFNSIGSYIRSGCTENIAHVWNNRDPLLSRNSEGIVSDGLLDWFLGKNSQDRDRFGIPVEKIDGQILFVYGIDDQSVGVKNLNYFVERMEKWGKKNYRSLVYPGAGHMLDPPIFPHFRSSYWPLFRDVFVWGGKPKLHHDAQVDSWRNILDFFNSNLS